eukprot:746179-Hanusia_phi.AAC.1
MASRSPIHDLLALVLGVLVLILPGMCMDDLLTDISPRRMVESDSSCIYESTTCELAKDVRGLMSGRLDFNADLPTHRCHGRRSVPLPAKISLVRSCCLLEDAADGAETYKRVSGRVPGRRSQARSEERRADRQASRRMRRFRGRKEGEAGSSALSNCEASK